MPATLLNTAGEPEREARSRRANALDALALFGLLLAALWPLAYGWGVLGGARSARSLAEGVLLLALLWAFAGSALWHRDSAASLGLGSPRALWRLIRERRGWARARLLAAVLAVFTTLVWISFAFWPRVARFFRLPPEARAWPDDFGGWLAMSSFSVAVAALVATCAIRYDNFGSAFRLALKVVAGFLAYALIAAWLHRGSAAFARIDLSQHWLDVIAYTFWGFTQQLIFTAYFGTRLRKGFGPSASPANVVALDRRRRVVFRGGLIAAVTLAPVAWLTLRLVRGPDISPALLPGFAAFAFPAGAVWTHFFCRDKKRMLVATLSGAIFGLIHIDSYGLVLVTGGLGTAFAYAAMEDRFRNLAVLGFVHGLLGSTFGKIFRNANELRISYHVGPWHIAEPSPTVLVIPLLCLAACALLAVWVARTFKPTLQPE